MSEGQAETKQAPATEPTPAPATAVVEKPNPEPKAQPSVEVETKQQTPEPQQPDKKELARTMFQKRQGEKEKKATERVAELEKELERLRQNATKETVTPKNEPPSLLDDPEGHAKWLREEAVKAARESIVSEVEAYEKQVAFQQASEKAADFLLTRSHIKADKALVDEVSKIVTEKYADVGAVNPLSAMRLAYVDLCAAKGIVPDMDGFKSGGLNATNGASSSGVKPSAPGTGKRVFAKGEARAYINAVDPGKDLAEFKRRVAEVDEAYAEGRVNR